MKKQLLAIATLTCLALNSYSQPTNIYQPNGSSTNFGKVAADSLNYYVVNYPALTLMKIDGSNNATLVTTLTVDPFQTMIFNNGKGIFPVSNGSPFKLFDGSTQLDISGGQLPMAGYTGDKVIASDYFHKGNTTYFRTSNKIYKTDYTSAASILTIGTVEYNGGTTEMQHTSNSILFVDPKDPFIPRAASIKRIDLVTGAVTKIDSVTVSSGNYEYGAVYNNEYYYCTPAGAFTGVSGVCKIYKISDNGTKTVIYTETASNKYLSRIVGVTPNGVIALIATAGTGTGTEYFSISGGVATALNFNTNADALPNGANAGGSKNTSSLVYFNSLDTLLSVSSNQALWVTDGTLAGTKKVVGGPALTFEASGLSMQFPGSAENCGNDLYFYGKNGSNAYRLIFVNGNTYSVQTYPNGLPSTQPSIRKTASGIVMVADDAATYYKAIYKVNCSTIGGVEENVSKQILFDLYPNPSNGAFAINLSENIVNCKLSVHNLLGELLFSSTLIDQSTNLNLDLNAGVYFITLDNKGQKTTKKIIVE